MPAGDVRPSQSTTSWIAASVQRVFGMPNCLGSRRTTWSTASRAASAVGYCGGKNGLAPAPRSDTQARHPLDLEAVEPGIDGVLGPRSQQTGAGDVGGTLPIGDFEQRGSALAQVGLRIGIPHLGQRPTSRVGQEKLTIGGHGRHLDKRVIAKRLDVVVIPDLLVKLHKLGAAAPLTIAPKNTGLPAIPDVGAPALTCKGWLIVAVV